MLDAIAVILIVTVVTVVAAMAVMWDVRRRLRRSLSRSAERALDDLAADTCDDLAGGGDSGSRAVRRYEATRDEVQAAARLRDLGRAAAKAEVRRWTGRVESGLRQARRGVSPRPSRAVERKDEPGDRAPRSTRR